MSEVIIPNVTRDDRIGSVFNHLFRIIAESEKLEGKVLWNFQDVHFFHPFFVFPFSLYRYELSNKKNVECKGMNDVVQSYFSTIKFFDFMDLREIGDFNNVLKCYKEKSYTPICRFSLSDKNIERMQSIIKDVILQQIKLPINIESHLSYMLGEFVCNMEEHSQGKYGYIFSQYLKKEKSLYLCLADDGISIYSSYIFKEKHLDKIDEYESSALRLAKAGYSSKDRPEAENRGYGISTNSNLLVKGFGGAFFILSGGAFHREEAENNIFIELPKSIRWNGTIILMKIPLSEAKNVNLYKYMER
ncbi:MAG: hypothetical protein IJZ01_02535 [Paraprevotella sp.]|nr:hypothetical protein [Paraprevotella sp.]MBQ8282436.1 hypothetical protein [Paraprevotella sp.]